jgi:hypothetical protein
MAKVIYDVVATIGTYNDKQGNEKKRYQTCGKVFESDKGYLSIKMDCIPVGQEWSGWFTLFAPKERDATPISEHSEAKGNGFQPQVIDDDAPF